MKDATGTTPFIQLPETYLHPKQQVGIVSMLMAATNNGKEK